MKVKLLVSRTGTGFVQDRGQVVNVSDAEGQRMIAGEQAEAIKQGRPASAETMARQPQETAARSFVKTK